MSSLRLEFRPKSLITEHLLALIFTLLVHFLVAFTIINFTDNTTIVPPPKTKVLLNPSTTDVDPPIHKETSKLDKAKPTEKIEETPKPKPQIKPEEKANIFINPRDLPIQDPNLPIQENAGTDVDVKKNEKNITKEPNSIATPSTKSNKIDTADDLKEETTNKKKFNEEIVKNNNTQKENILEIDKEDNKEILTNEIQVDDLSKSETKITPDPKIDIDIPLSTDQGGFSILRKPKTNALKEESKPESFVPDELKSTLRGKSPERTNQNDIQYTLSDYGWSFEQYAEKWAADIRRWWAAPIDYVTGKYPQGGSVWISIKMSKSGELIDYNIYQSGVSNEMELRALQALVSSFERPPLPQDLEGTEITFNWQLIYPIYNINPDILSSNENR